MIDIDFDAVDREKLKAALQTLVKGLRFAASFTQTTLDDKAVDALALLSNEDWFVDVVAYLIELAQKKLDPAQLAELGQKLKEALSR